MTLREILEKTPEVDARWVNPRHNVYANTLQELKERLPQKLLEEASAGLTAYESKISSSIDEDELVAWMKSEGIRCFKFGHNYYSFQW